MTILEIIPIDISDISVTLTDPANIDPATWALINYASGEYCSFQNKKYISLQSMTSSDPKQPDIEPVYWKYVGNINRYASVDPYLNTQTSASGDIVLTFDTNGARGIFIANSIATSINVVQENNGITVLDETYQMLKPVLGWYQYFFNPIEYRKDLYIPLGLFHTSTVTITLTNPAGAKIGGLFRGIPHDIGYAKWDSEIGIIDNSKYIDDEYGNTYLSEGYWRKKMSIDYAIETSKIDSLIDTIVKVRGKSSVFIASEKYDSLMGYGVIRDISQPYSNPKMSFGRLQFQGNR